VVPTHLHVKSYLNAMKVVGIQSWKISFVSIVKALAI
jgi:hypothetical protein